MKNSHLFEALLTKFWPIWAWPCKGWPEKAVKCIIACENTRRYTLYYPFATEAGVFFSAFTAFSGLTQLHSVTRFKP